ncbi:hypothetical protein C9E81_20575 [Paracoccus alkanivorans]|uniref:Uncharacterized protein n=1 Tax=Paracoccus alkanivorans TaxID=2116655 RepID=A0A3M0M2I0_9RHOB|nr:hypothetical protein C9E81_20575 [Paracoccus alkanivorans]
MSPVMVPAPDGQDVANPRPASGACMPGPCVMAQSTRPPLIAPWGWPVEAVAGGDLSDILKLLSIRDAR